MNPLKASLIGRTIDPKEVRDVTASVIDLWRTTQSRLASGEIGWYRKVHENDRVGVVATAQGILALGQLGCEIADARALLQTLLRKQRADGSWAFVSNLDDQGVVDATAWAVLALVQLGRLAECACPELTGAVARALGWLQGSVNHDGGWGICAGQPTRCYSTSLAVRALAAAGRESHTATLRGLKTLLALQDQASGGWRDATGTLSIPSTAGVLLTLAEFPDPERTFHDVKSRATHWLMQIARASSYWTAGPYARPREEVEVRVRKRRRRVEFGFSPRPLAIDALIRSGRHGDPLVVYGFTEMLSALRGGNWEGATGSQDSVPKSWMIYDVGSCIRSFRQVYKQPGHSVWVGRSRVVEHSPFQGAVARQLQRHRKKIAGLAAGGAIVALLRVAGVITSFTLGAVVAVLGAVVINVLSNVLSELLKEWNEQK